MPNMPPGISLPRAEPLVGCSFPDDIECAYYKSGGSGTDLIWSVSAKAGRTYVFYRPENGVELRVNVRGVAAVVPFRVTVAWGVTVPGIPASFFKDWRPEASLFSRNDVNDRLVFLLQPTAHDLTDLADAANFAATHSSI